MDVKDTMWILRLYLLKRFLTAAAMTTVVFAFVFLVGNALKEILTLLVNQQADLRLIGWALALLLPFVLVFALPMGALTGCLLVFGRMSADQEFLAGRAGGINWLSWISPVIGVAILFCGVCSWINMKIAPEARRAYKNLFFEFSHLNISNLITPNQTIRRFDGQILYVQAKENDLLKGITLSILDEEGSIETILFAEEGRAVYIEPNQFKLELDQVRGQKRGQDHWEYFSSKKISHTFDFELPGERQAKLKELTLFELLEQRRSTETRLSEDLEGEERKQFEKHLAEINTQIHRQAGFSFASLSFVMIGAPLGVQAHRRETSVGIAMAILLLLVYYGFVIVGLAQATSPLAWIFFWAPNALFIAMGAWLLHRANKM